MSVAVDVALNVPKTVEGFTVDRYDNKSLTAIESAIDIKLLDTPVSKTNDIIVLQGFLLRKIEAMKSDRTADRNILYDDIYKILGINEPQKVKNQLQRIRKYMDTMLEYWKGEKYITDFIVNKKGKSYYSVTIYI